MAVFRSLWGLALGWPRCRLVAGSLEGPLFDRHVPPRRPGRATAARVFAEG